ncbi:hypothetical protein B0T14DRAFT_58592 [Immersiella caudata]|uniref:Extracellular membrane protein CFEM domain-containing protein n=1 Tax=Immersiella caudata TaxID=314043 RepID=A0AA39XFV3_9PEZI|nr:hypothetical protein B0T14DRAFT_58592 [Immersiella caudata]
MKTGVVLALAASAAATGFRNFPPFNCPENTDNKCTDKQKPGFSFADLNLGPFTGYNDFGWKGFTCGNKGGNGRFNNGGSGKTIGGVCTSDKKNSPSFGCGPKVDKFSLGSIFVKPEFDCDLEFVYDMPDGKTCKHRSFCKKSGSNVINKQCGGAKNVTIIFPPQPNKPKPVCSIDIETISFDCNPPKTTFTPPAPPATTPPTLPASSTSNSPVESTPPAVSSPPVVPPVVSSPPVVPPIVSSPPVVPPVESSPPVKPPVESSPPVAPPVESTPPAVPSEETSTVVVSSTLTIPTTAVVTTTEVTTFETTSTIFSTVVSTITSCAPTVPNCGNGGIKTTVVTVAVSTTICPATETITTVLTTSTDITTVLTTTTSVPIIIPPTTDKPTVSLTSNSPVVPTGPAKPPVDTLPCPDVVPKCLNTFLFDVKCKDNSDHACYCPDTIFVKNVMECLFAHGEAESIISEAVIFFQGICAPFVPSNPGIVTGVPTYVTVTAPPTAVVPIFTTVTVDATTVLPCTDDAGEVIPSSSTTSTIFTTLTLPQVGFTTQSGSVGVIPVTLPPFPVETPKGPIGAPVAPGAPGAPGFFTTAAPTGPIGTGGIRPVPTGAVVTAGSGRVTASLGFSLAITILAVIGL